MCNADKRQTVLWLCGTWRWLHTILHCTITLHILVLAVDTLLIHRRHRRLATSFRRREIIVWLAAAGMCLPGLLWSQTSMAHNMKLSSSLLATLPSVNTTVTSNGRVATANTDNDATIVMECGFHCGRVDLLPTMLILVPAFIIPWLAAFCCTVRSRRNSSSTNSQREY